MTEAPPPAPGPLPAPGADAAPGADGAPVVRRPRKRFIGLGLGIGLLIIVVIGLTTSFGTSPSSTDTPHDGGPVPSFTRQNIGPSGPAQVSVSSDGGANGKPGVLLFFGNWCPSCHQELPPLAAAVARQDRAGGALAGIRVIGVDSEDSTSSARSFIHSAGVTFPVAYDPDVQCDQRCSLRVRRRSLLGVRQQATAPIAEDRAERALPRHGGRAGRRSCPARRGPSRRLSLWGR